MNTKGVASAAVTGARHLRVPRNGQDAAATWLSNGLDAGSSREGTSSREGVSSREGMSLPRGSLTDNCGAIVVCDGCSAGASSEVGARLASQLVIAELEKRLPTARPDEAMWSAIREAVATQIGRIVERMPDDRVVALHEHFLFTIVAAAWRGDEVAVWALGDGAYALGDQVRTLGPFEDNRPPYLAYDLLGEPQRAHFVLTDAACGRALVATDGIAEIGFEPFLGDIDRYFANPDALRRELVIRARGTERVDWYERRIERRPAALQDDGAIALMRWS
jgi:hypothetical protein